MAYKTGAILVEDPGWYIWNVDGKDVGDSAWETQEDQSHLARIGLAVDKLSPNVLSIDKIEELKTISYNVIRDKIGLAGTLTYDFGLKLTMDDTMVDHQEELLNITPQYKGQSVEYMERNVMVNMGKQLFVNCTPLGTSSSSIQVDVSERLAGDNHDMTVRIYNIPGPGNIKDVMWQAKSTDPDQVNFPTPFVYNEGFIVRINGVVMQDQSLASFGAGDTVEVVIFGDMIPEETQYIWVSSDPAKPIFPTTGINYYHDPVYRLKDVCYPGVFMVEVWSNDFA